MTVLSRLKLFKLNQKQQTGSVLLIALVFLTLLSLLGVTILNSSFLELKMAGNAQDHADSMQIAQAGLDAVMALRGSPKDPFARFDQYANNEAIDQVFTALKLSPPPLAEITAEKNQIDTRIRRTIRAGDCLRESRASSTRTIQCHYYEIESHHHQLITGAASSLMLGVAQQIPATQTP